MSARVGKLTTTSIQLPFFFLSLSILVLILKEKKIYYSVHSSLLKGQQCFFVILI